MESLVTGDRAELELVVASTLDNGAVTYLQLPTERERERLAGVRGGVAHRVSIHSRWKVLCLRHCLLNSISQLGMFHSLQRERERERKKVNISYLSVSHTPTFSSSTIVTISFFTYLLNTVHVT